MSVRQSITKTIKYAKKFKVVLTTRQLKSRLIGNQVFSDIEINREISSGRYDLKNRESLDGDKLEMARWLTKRYLSKFKEILMVGITGSVAAESAKSNDDIDLLIITKANRLWWTRLRLRWLVWKIKIPHRRAGKKEKRNEFCFNLWLDEKALKIPNRKMNLQSALDLVMMKPILNRKETYEKFIMINDWAKKYVATGYNKLISNLKFKIYKDKKKSLFLNMVNYVCFLGQYIYMKPKMKGEVVNYRQAFFHPVV